MKAVHAIGKSLGEQLVVEKLDQLDELLSGATEELEGIREAFISYQTAMTQILKEIEDDKQN